MKEAEKIKELISLMEEANLQKLQLKSGDFEVLIERGGFAHPIIPVSHSVIGSEKTVSHVSEKEDTARYIKSPMVGTFYGAPSPDQAAFVKQGDFVKEDTVVCIIEAMKVMNEVKAGVSGKIQDILVSNSRPVEFGTKLFRIE